MFRVFLALALLFSSPGLLTESTCADVTAGRGGALVGIELEDCDGHRVRLDDLRDGKATIFVFIGVGSKNLRSDIRMRFDSS